MRRIGAIGLGADRREHANADAADTGDRQEFSTLAAPQIGWKVRRDRVIFETAFELAFATLAVANSIGATTAQAADVVGTWRMVS